jgi:dihydroflavonol-4-reductase
MTVVVTGAAGFVGRNLIPALVRSGREVRALIEVPVASEMVGEERCGGVRVEQVVGNVLDPASLTRAFTGAEIVYHLAGRVSIAGDPDGQVRRVNVDGTRNVVEACRKAGVRRLVHFSSIHALRPFPVEDPVDETRPLHDGPDSDPYERSKAAGEREVLRGVDGGLDAVIVNPTGILGPHDLGPSPQGRAILSMMRGELPATMAGGFNWVDVRDVSEAALAAEARGRAGERYLLAGEWVTVPEITARFAEAAGVAPPSLTLPIWAARAVGVVGDVYARVSRTQPSFTSESVKAVGFYRHVRRDKAERELGFSPRPLDETVRDTAAWFRSIGMLGKRPRRPLERVLRAWQ